MIGRELMTLKEVSEYTGVSLQTLYNMRCRYGKLPFPSLKFGQRILVRKSTLDRWIAEQEA